VGLLTYAGTYWENYDLVDEYPAPFPKSFVALIVAFVAWVVKRNLTTPRLECGGSEDHESEVANQPAPTQCDGS